MMRWRELGSLKNVAKRNVKADLVVTVHRDETYLRTKLQIYISPHNGAYTLLAAAPHVLHGRYSFFKGIVTSHA
jgi:hypothetical protein